MQKKQKVLLLAVLVLLSLLLNFAACNSLSDSGTITDAITLTTLKTEVSAAFDRLTFASDLLVDNERATISFAVENGVSEIALSELKMGTGTLSVAESDGTAVTTLTLKEGGNVFSLTATSGNISLSYTLKITRKAAASPEPSIASESNTEPTTPPEQTTDPESSVDPAPTHTHTYSDVWSKDDDYHWHAASCEHTSEVKDKAAHDWQATFTHAPTEESDGFIFYVCSVCAATKRESLPKQEHQHTFGEWVTYRAATCMEKGEERRYCTCNAYQTREIKIDPQNHDLSHHDAKSPTCTSAGWKEYDKCSRCSYTTFVEIPALGHSYSDVWSKNDDYHWHAATCGHDVSADKAEHLYGDWITDREADYSSAGSKHRLCSVCLYVQNKTIPKLETDRFVISFDLNGGQTTSNTAPITVTELTASSFFFNITKSDYTFRGWAYDGVKVFDEKGVQRSDPLMAPTMTFVAIFTQTVNLYINTNIPGAGTISGSGEYAYDSEVDVAAHPFQGYEFVGWTYSNAVLSNQEDYRYKMWDTDVTISAIFKLSNFTLSLTSNNASHGLVFIDPTGVYDLYEKEKEKSVTYTYPVTVATYTKTDIRFLGWFNANNELVTTNAVFTFLMPNHNYSLVAKWDYFSIDYVLNNGTNDPSNPSVYSSESEDIVFAAPTRAQYIFGGWYTDKDFTTPITGIRSGSYDNVTVYAKWIVYTVTTMTNLVGAGTYTQETDTIVSVGESVTLTAETNLGFTWLGWYEDEKKVSSGASLTYSFIMSAKSRILTAKWAMIDDELQNFSFSTSPDKCTITGVVDKSIQTAVIPNFVTDIGAEAFAGCSMLNTVKIGAHVTSIGQNAFSGCTASILWDDNSSISTIGYLSFSNYKGKTITIPESVTSIGQYAFSGCSGLTSITIPNSVTTISPSAFRGCPSLVEMTLPFVGYSKNVSSESSAALFGYIFGTSSYVGGTCIEQYYTSSKYATYYIPSSLRTVNVLGGNLSYHVFSNCSMLTSVTIGNGVNSIEYSPFSGCSGLSSITIENGVNSIGNSAFYGCSSLSSITIPSSVTSIGDSAFYACTGLTSITIGSGINSIGGSAFSGCSELSSIYYAGDIASWCGIAGLNNLMAYGASNKSLYINGMKVEGDFVIPSSVTSIGSSAFRGCSGLTSIAIPSSVTSVGDSAFSGCTGLTSITIPSNVTSIWSSAFSNCPIEMATIPTNAISSISKSSKSTIKTVVINGGTSIGYEAFDGCSGLTSITIPTTVTSIGKYSFRGCYGLTSITIPSSVTSVGDSAFSGCTGLTSITIPSSVTSIGSDAFYNCSGLTSITIPSSVTSIGSGAFYNCTGLTSITIPTTVTSVGKYSFRGCYGLTSITIPSSVTSVGDSAFYGCTGLTSVTFAEGSQLTSIGSNAFYNCTGLTSITIPNSVTSIGGSAFYGCTGLTSIYYGGDIAGWCGIAGLNNLMSVYGSSNKSLYINGTKIEGDFVIPSSVTSIGDSAFSGCTGLTSITIPTTVTSIGKYSFRGCYGLTSITIPSSVTSVGDSAFSGCTGLTSITIPSSVTSIGSDAFYNCSGLTSITIPSSVTSIGSGAFYNCTGLTSITIPTTVTSVGKYSFRGCYGLTSITIPSSVTSVGSGAFGGCSSLENMTIPFVGATKDGTSNTLFGYIFGANFSSDNADRVPSSLKAVEITDSVTSIGDYAFYGCSSLTSVTIPSSVTIIGSSAFSGCTGLTSITLPSSVTIIGSSAFSGCTGLTAIYYTGDIAGWCGIAGLNNLMMGYGSSNKPLYINGTKVEGDFVIPSNVTSIGSSAFYTCTGLTSITIPSSVTSIGSSAFRNCTGLTSITIPSSVKGIGSYAFYGCSGLTSVTFAEGSQLPSIGNSAFSGCTSLTSITIPSSVTTIGSSSFSRCGGLSSITIGNHVIRIEDHAFSDCSELTSITIPSSVTSIYTGAFLDCANLTLIIFQGTKAEWKAITKQADWDANTGNYTIRCTDGNISK